MTRELFLLRNAQVDLQVNCEDFDRPLKMAGKRAAQCIGVWLAERDLIPDLIISSPASRALATAQKCCKTMGLSVKHIWKDARIYNAEPEAILSVLSDLNLSLNKILLVGHNPGLKKLVDQIAKKHSSHMDNQKMSRATLARVSIDEKWDNLLSGNAKLIDIVHASSLQEKFPYPNIDGKKKRKRPAYYYTQSGVLPYRIRQGKLEIMLVSSSNNKRWVIPKGIVDPGLTPQQSAVKEAFEEAGIKGFVDNNKLGDYQYRKWGAKCSVAVYPLEVTTVLPETEWEESHRERKWVSPKKAAKLIANPELSDLIKLFEKNLSDSEKAIAANDIH